MFIRAELDENAMPSHGGEWGWHSEVVPAVGDTLWLRVEVPDEEPTGNHHLEATVIRRIFPIDDEPEGEAWLTVHTASKIPEGHIANSPEWPSAEFGARMERLRRSLAQIRGKPCGPVRSRNDSLAKGSDGSA
jgi:hypothetical protein